MRPPWQWHAASSSPPASLSSPPSSATSTAPVSSDSSWASPMFNISSSSSSSSSDSGGVPWHRVSRRLQHPRTLVVISLIVLVQLLVLFAVMTFGSFEASLAHLVLTVQATRGMLGLSVDSSRIAVCYLTSRPSEALIDWARHLARSCAFDVFILADDNRFDASAKNLVPLGHQAPLHPLSDSVCAWTGQPPVYVLQYRDDIVIAANYTRMNYFVNNMKANGLSGAMAVSAWEKAMFAFTRDARLTSRYEFTWLMEQDLFVPSVDALRRISQKAKGFDFVAPPADRYEKDVYWQNWGDLIEHSYPRPWFKGMVCMVGMSRSMFEAIEAVVNQWHRLFFLESILNTVAEQNEHLRVLRPVEMIPILYRPNDIYALQHILDYPNFFFHPVKNEGHHSTYRQAMTALQMAESADQ